MQWKKIVFSTNSAETTGYSHAKKPKKHVDTDLKPLQKLIQNASQT